MWGKSLEIENIPIEVLWGVIRRTGASLCEAELTALLHLLQSDTAQFHQLLLRHF